MPLDGVVAAKIASQGPLFGRANVVGVAIGTKRIHEHDTRERCISVFVERKWPIEHLRRRDVVPKEMSGVLTDVVETGRFSAMPLTQTLDEGRTHRMRPAEGGVSIGHYRITAGTLGVLARRGGRPVILSNNHVLANGNAGAIGDPILQPGPVDGGRLQDAVARLTDFVPIHFNERAVGPVGRFLERAVAPLLGAFGLSLKRLPNGQSNLVDAAVAEPIDPSLVASDILDIGHVTGTAEAAIGLAVRKSGRTTGLTEGHVTAVDAVVEVDYGTGKTAIFREQIVSDMVSKGGDSGSIVVDDRSHAVGL